MAKKPVDNENVASLFGDDFEQPVEAVPELKIEVEEKVAEQEEPPKVDLEAPVAPPVPELTEKQKEEYMTIFDAIMFEGSYKEVVNFGKRYKILLRSRTAGEEMYIAQRMDTMNFKTILAYQNQSALLTLAHSLVQFCNDDLSTMDLKTRYEYVSKLSSGIVPMLSSALVEFDAKISAAMEYGKENF